jgi:hypothetical protein
LNLQFSQTAQFLAHTHRIPPKYTQIQAFIYWHTYRFNPIQNLKLIKEQKMNFKKIIRLGTLITTATLWAAPHTQYASIETSKPYHHPQLFTIRTAKILESYNIGLSGSGNIHKAMSNFHENGLRGSVAMGFGDVLELGYEYKENKNNTLTTQHLFNGHIKVQLIKEQTVLPAITISAGQNIFENMLVLNGQGEGKLDITNFEILVGKTLSIAGHEFSLYPGLRRHFSKLNSWNGESLNSTQENSIDYHLGATWQRDPSVLFIYELKYIRPIGINSASKNIELDRLMENNMGARYYLKNWLFLDAGIRHTQDLKTKASEFTIHANLTGVLPMKSIFQRMASH